MEEITINLFEMFKDDFLGSRYDGEQVRELEDKIILENKQKVVLNFDGIKGITQSFADEIAGIYARAFGIDFVKQNIRAINMNKTVKLILNVSIQLSIKYGQRISTPPSSASNIVLTSSNP
jgi:sugar-specific transcriptional regulator TrmB